MLPVNVIMKDLAPIPCLAADHFNPLVEGGAPGVALEAIITVAIAAPVAFQHDPLVKAHLLGSDQYGVCHVKFFRQLKISFHLLMIHLDRRRPQAPVFCFSAKAQAGIGIGSFIITFNLLG
jgi:hypothetical protein